MSGIVGYLQGFSDTRAFAPIVRRNDDIDAMLVKAGINPETINAVCSPMVGACGYATARVLVSPKLSANLGDLWRQATDSTDPWELHLVEPGGGPAYSTNDDPADAVPLPSPEIVVIDNVGIPKPMREEVAAPQLTATRSEPVTDSETLPGSATVSESTRGAIKQRASVTVEAQLQTQASLSAPAQAGILQGLQGNPRSMVYVGLIVTSIIELRRDAAGSVEPNATGRPRANDNALFVIDLVDPRYRLQGIRSMAYQNALGANDLSSNGPIRGGDGLNYTGGLTRSRFNMLAETPVAFEAQTVKRTITYPPAMLDFPGFADAAADSDRAPSWNHYIKNNRTARHWTNTAAAATHFQEPYSRDDLLSMFAKQVELAAGVSGLTLDLSFYHSQLAANGGEQAFDDGDVFNLDFSGMTLGEALDTFAQRLGCVWLYDRAAPSLVLSMARKSLVSGQANLPRSVPDLGNWLSEMEEYRVAGYVNTFTLDVPQTVFVSHAMHYCSRCGPERSGDWGIQWFGVYGPEAGQGQQNFVYTFAHLVDSRTQTTNDGVLSTKFVTGLNADGPGLSHALSPTVTHTVVEIRDHIPALVGHNTPNGYVPVWLPGTNWYTQTGGTWTFGPEYWFMKGKQTTGIGKTNLKLDTSIAPDYDAPDFEVPWNYTSPTIRTSYRNLNVAALSTVPTNESDLIQPSGYQIFDTNLKRRREILQTRITELRKVADGDATFARMPSNMMYGTMRQITPSVGLQYESVHFGAPDIATVRYRVWGKNTNPLLYPYGAKFEETTGGFGVSTALTSGRRTVAVRRPHKGNVLRVFMARIISKQTVTAIPEQAGANDYTPFQMTKYAFVEATPDANPFTMYWSSSDALGNKGLTSGIAFNIYEQWFNTVAELAPTNPPRSVGGMPFQQNSGPNDDLKIQIPYVPAPLIVPVYEVANRLGFSSYWIAVQPDMEIRCAANPPGGAPMPTPPTWPYMGASGAAISNPDDLADIIENA